MAAYTAIVPISIWMLRGREPTPLGYSIAFLPVIPSIFAMFAFMRMFRGLDQLQRRIQLEPVRRQAEVPVKNNVRDLRGQVNWTQANLAEKLWLLLM